MVGLGDQYVLTGLQLRQIDQREIADQHRHVMNRRLAGVEHVRVVHQRLLRQQHLLGIQRILVEIVRGKTRHPVADGEALHIGADRNHLAGHLAAQPGRQACVTRRQVLTPEHIVPAHADGADIEQHFARPRHGRVAFFQT